MTFDGLNLADGAINTSESVIATDVDLSEKVLKSTPRHTLLYNLGAKIQGINSDGGLLAVAGGNLYKDGELVGTGLASRGTATFSNVGRQVYINVDGSKAMVWDGGFRQMGIAPATLAFTSVDAGAGHLADGIDTDYTYAYTYYDASTNRESALSPLLTIKNVRDRQLKLTNLLVSVDSSVTNRRIYRLGGSLLDFWLVDEIDNVVTEYVDRIPDQDIIATSNIIEFTDNFQPPFFKQMVWHNDVMIGITTDGLSLRFSRSLDGRESFPLNFIAAVAGKGNKFVSIVSYHSTLIIAMEEGFKVLYGNSLETFYTKDVSGVVGCIAPNSLVRDENGSSVYYLSNTGVRVANVEGGKDILGIQLQPDFIDGKAGFFTDGINAGFTSDGINAGFDAATRMGKEVGIFYKGAYILSHKDGKTNIIGTRNLERKVKATYSSESTITAFYIDNNGLVYGNDAGDIREWETGLEDLPFIYQTVAVDFAKTEQVKEFSDIFLKYSGVVTVGDLIIETYIDSVLVDTWTPPVSSGTVIEQRVIDNVSGTEVFYKIIALDTKTPKVFSIKTRFDEVESG